MTSKSAWPDRQTALPRASDHAKSLLKDWPAPVAIRALRAAGLKEAMLLLIANEAPLGAEWLEHALKGEWADHRECHIGGDFLLIYQVQGMRIIFVRAGTHRELFGE